ncbi:zinc finger, CCHC-type containing protein [Tanacetum coccineum]
MATAIALGIYLAYFPYEEGFQYLAMVLAVLVQVITSIKNIRTNAEAVKENERKELINQQNERKKSCSKGRISKVTRMRGLILNGMSNSLFDIYQNVESSKELWDSLEAKYMVEDASSKKFLVSNFTNYKMTDSRPVMEQYNELLGILGRFIQQKINMDEDSDKPKSNNVAGPLVFNMVEHNNSFRYNDNKGKHKHHDNTKVDPNKKSKVTCWKCRKHGHLKKDCKDGKVGNKANGSGTNGSVDGSTNSLKGQNMFNKSFQVCYVTYVSEAFYVQDDDVAWLNIVNDNIGSAFMSTSKLNDSILWHARLGHVHFKRMQDMSKDGLIPAFDMDTKNDLCDMHATPSLRNKKYFVTFINEASRVPNKRNMITSYELWTKRKPKLNYLRVWGYRTVDDPKTLDEAMKSHDVAFWKEAINDEMDSFMGNNTWVLVDLPPGFKPLGCKLIFKIKLKVDGTIEKFKYHKTTDCYGINSQSDYSSDGCEDNILKFKFDETGKGVINCLYVDDVLIFGTNQVQVDLTKEFLSSSTPMDTSEKLMPNNGQAVSQLNYSRHWQAIQRVLKYLKKSIDYNLTYTGYPSILEGYTDASWISNTEDNSSTSGWVFLLGGGAIYWAFKKQTCITSSTMEL